MCLTDSPGPEPPKPEYTDADAVFGGGGTYRYRLSRTWDGSGKTATFVLLNPSTADATTDDRTLTRCVKYAAGMGFGGLVVVNLFALRTPDPADLDDHPDPVGPDNDAHIRAAAADADRVIVGWGNGGTKRGRAREVEPELGAELYAIGTTAAGHPRHPSRTPYDVTVERFSYGRPPG
jgi:hypothetical protein